MNQFSAAGSSLGTLAQVHYALLRSLQSQLPEDAEVSIETEDDFVIAPVGFEALREFYQSKHHIMPQGIGDMDFDLWKSIGNWLEYFDSSKPVARILLTTATPTEGSAAEHLSGGTRDVTAAVSQLIEAARHSTNANTQKARDCFLNLAPADRISFVANMWIQGGAPSADELLPALAHELRYATRKQRLEALIFRLLGWWDLLIVDHLASLSRNQKHTIRLFDIQAKVIEIADSLVPESLPLDFEDLTPPSDAEVTATEDRYVHQLRWIRLSKSRLASAILEHNQAYRQRSAWQAESLVDLVEMRQYDERIRREWCRVFDALSDDDEDGSTEDERREAARELYQKLQLRSLPEMRNGMRMSYVSLGTLQILADRGVLGWHPDWERHFSQSFPDEWEILRKAAS